MKYKDYYAILGVERNADTDQIKAAYRKLARKYHPDVSKEPGAEEKFKEVKEAYETLKDPEKRALYDRLGTQQPGHDFRPPPDWWKQFAEHQGAFEGSFEDIDLADIFAGLGGRRRSARARGGPVPIAGEDYEAVVHLTLEQAARGAEVDLQLAMPEYDETGFPRRVMRTIKARIPPGSTDGKRLRLPGKGGKGANGGPDGDLYLTVALHPHPLFRVDGHDLYLDLPIAPWEAALGASVEVPTLAGPVQLKIPPRTRAGRQLRLAGRGLPKPGGGAGDLYAVVQIVMPSVLTEKEEALFRQLASVSTFNPRGHFAEGGHR